MELPGPGGPGAGAGGDRSDAVDREPSPRPRRRDGGLQRRGREGKTSQGSNFHREASELRYAQEEVRRCYAESCALQGQEEVTGGCIFEKQNVNDSWVDVCEDLPYTEQLCTYKVGISFEVKER